MLHDAGNSTNAENSTRKKKSIVWQYFSKVEVKDRGVKVSNVRCSICGTLLPDSSTTKSGSSTGKYRQHLKTHVIQNSTSSRQSIFGVGELFNRQPNTPPVLHTAANVTALVEANIVKWMVATGKPFIEVESEYFPTIFKGIPGVNPLFKSASTATSRILEVYMTQKSELRCELATTAISVSISVDGWTSPTRCAMFAIVAHWITGEWEAREAVLHIAELPGSHTGVALAQEVFTCLRFYDIKIMRAIMPPRYKNLTGYSCQDLSTTLQNLGMTCPMPKSRSIVTLRSVTSRIIVPYLQNRIMIRLEQLFV
ncbi:hypothetical protein V1517DRAFT_334253 [Lipomyces orientalis]|uniref:Uncharacterized protein n=1 Tax=Lipomyces orientalis TaxID=1233043 RepID=A0ACC3TDG3_9ASCO